MRSWFKRTGATIGYRGRAILHFAVIWVILGIATILTPMKPDAAALEHNHGQTVLLVANLPIWMQSGIWFTSAVIAVCYARSNPLKPRDRVAFQALIVPPAIELLSYAFAVAYYLAIGHAFIWIYFFGILLWGFFVSLVLTFASWPEPKDTHG